MVMTPIRRIPVGCLLPRARIQRNTYSSSVTVTTRYADHPRKASLPPYCQRKSKRDPAIISPRKFSSRSRNRSFKLDALPFSISPEEALEKFRTWAIQDQGLNYFMNWNSTRIGAAYVPVWSFDLNIRFVVTSRDGVKSYDFKPSLFANVYESQSVIHLPGLGAYAGYSFRRSLVHPIVNTTLVFLGDQTVPFDNYMLRSMKLQSTGESIEILPDPWNSSRSQAFATLLDDLEQVSNSEAEGTVKVQTEIVSSRRVYLPIYMIDYTVLGVEYRAFTSGCDKAAGVSGVNHRVFGRFQPTQEINQATQTFLSNAWTTAQTAASTGLRTFSPNQTFSIIFIGLQLFGGLFARLLLRIPAIALFSGIFVGFRKIVQPWMDSKRASADWERQREHEAQMKDHESHSYGDDFSDTGSAQRYFYRNKEKILSYLGGYDAHGQGDFDWYKDWEEWAKQQWERQQNQYQSHQHYQQQHDAYRQQGKSYQKQQTSQQQQKSKTNFKWEFDPNDPYSVLGVSRAASKGEVSAAFRRQMLKYHPDRLGPDAKEIDKRRAVERSKLITNAYRELKGRMK